MSVNPHPKYPGHWVIRFYPNGKKKDPITGKVKNEYLVFKGSQAEAEAYHLELVRAARPDKTVIATPTFSQLFIDFAEYYKNKTSESTFKDYLLNWSNKLSDHFGHIRPNHLTPGQIEAYKTLRISQGVKPRTVNKELNYLASMITWASDPAIGLANPMAFRIQRFPKKLAAAPLPIVPTRPQILAIIDKIGEEVRPLACLLYYAGLRFSEAANLKAEDILIDQGAIVINAGKGNKSRIVPIVLPLVPILEALKKQIPKGPLFINPSTGTPYKSIKKSIKAAAIRAGVPLRIYSHLFRHGFGVHSTLDGIGLRTLQNAMGHSSSTTTEIYSQLAAQALIEDYSNKWGSRQSEVKREQKGTKKRKGPTGKTL